MASALTLYNAIYTRLTAVQTAGSFYSDVGGRIHLVAGSPDEPTPILIVKPLPGSLTRYLQGPDDVELHFQTWLWGDYETTAVKPFIPETLAAIDDKLFALLDRQVLAGVTGFGNVQIWALDFGNIDRDDKAWVITRNWKLTATPTS